MDGEVAPLVEAVKVLGAGGGGEVPGLGGLVPVAAGYGAEVLVGRHGDLEAAVGGP